MRQTVFRTGLSRGRVYNDTKSNLTTFPEGAGNNMVGSWSRDYSGLSGNSVLYAGEFSAIIADGRTMLNFDDSDSDADTEEDEDSVDQGALCRPGDRSCHISEAEVEFTVGAPSWEDAGVWSWSSTQTDSAFIYESTLAEWLDDQNIGVDEAPIGDHDLWWTFMDYLRIPWHMAIYRVHTNPQWKRNAK